MDGAMKDTHPTTPNTTSTSADDEAPVQHVANTVEAQRAGRDVEEQIISS